jgi:hypothetical protein
MAMARHHEACIWVLKDKAKAILVSHDLVLSTQVYHGESITENAYGC